MDLILIIVGTVLLLAGGQGVVMGGESVAKRFGVSELLVGLVVVSIGTSLPEFLVSLQAALNGSPGIALGNVVGSNIANSLLILGVCGYICTIRVPSKSLRKDAYVMVAATAALVTVIALFGEFGRIAGGIFVAGIVWYVWYSYRTDKGSQDAVDKAFVEEGEMYAKEVRGDSLFKGIVFLFGGIAGVVYGAELLVKGAIDISKAIGISEAVIGVTLVAVGTSLPELATSAIAARKGSPGIAVGNVIGSNIFNIFAIMGGVGLIHPVSAPDGFFGNVVFLGLATLLLLPFLSSGVVDRRYSYWLLGLYGAFLAFQVV